MCELPTRTKRLWVSAEAFSSPSQVVTDGPKPKYRSGLSWRRWDVLCKKVGSASIKPWKYFSTFNQTKLTKFEGEPITGKWPIVKLTAGQIVEVEVERVAVFGLFCRYEDIELLVLIPEVSWIASFASCEQVADLGDRLTVQIIHADQPTGRVSASIKKMYPNPWENGSLEPGQEHQARVIRYVENADRCEGDPAYLIELVPGALVMLCADGVKLEKDQRCEVTVVKSDPFKRSVEVARKHTTSSVDENNDETISSWNPSTGFRKILKDLPEDQQAQFISAVNAFQQPDPINVTSERLHEFLVNTQTIDWPPGERLWLLAIGLEYEEFETGWDGLRRIYQAAADAVPADNPELRAQVLRSWGISAQVYYDSERTVPDLQDRIAIAQEARQVLHEALDLTPEDSQIAYVLGFVDYFHPSRDDDDEKHLSSAIEWFQRALEWDTENFMARLYLAHCFHDREDWLRAIAEYEKVDLEKLAQERAIWRSVKCREQLAHCYAHAGNHDKAIGLFRAFLDDADSLDEDALLDHFVHVHELVDAVTNVLDDPELLQRTRALVERLEIEWWYESEFGECSRDQDSVR